MASGVYVFPDKAKLNFFSATDLLAATAANFREALVTSAYIPANATDEVWADVSANEIAAGNGYTAGGAAMSAVTLTQTAGVVKFTAAPTVWNATGGNIPAWRRSVIYYLGTLNGKINPLLGHFLGDSTPADTPATSSGNPLTITHNASGILAAT